MPQVPTSRKGFILGAILTFCLLLSALLPWQALVSGASPQEKGTLLQENLSAEEVARRALADTLYYRFDRWMRIFQEKISNLEAAPQNVKTEMELMKYHFFLAALNVEFSHTLGFTSKYKIQKVEDDCLFHIRRAKQIAKTILDKQGLTSQQKSQAYLYLGAAEGYLGILEFGAGNFLRALINGFRADNHLEEALILDPDRIDAHLGLGVYRYSNSRLGGLGNLLLQGGKDRRHEGTSHLERVVRTDSITLPLAIKTLIWFYISEQINPDNDGLAPGRPLSHTVSRTRALELIEDLEDRYFKNPPTEHFIGNKGLAMMRAVQHILDGEYAEAKVQFEKILEIIRFLREKKGYRINPQQENSTRAGIKFSDAMLSGSTVPKPVSTDHSACSKINRQISFLDNDGTVIEYDVEKIRDELNAIFYQRLVNLSIQNSC